MAKNVEEFVILLRDKVSPKLKTAEAQLERLRGKAEKTQSTFSKMARVAAGAFAAVGIAQVGREIVSTLSEFEKFEAVLTNTLGSGSAAQQALQMITDFAATTPFQVDGLTGAFVKLANQGFVPTTNEMRKLGDLAASTGKDFDQLTEAIIDAQTGEFERLKEFGIRASKEGDKVTFTFKGVETQTNFTADAMRNYVLSLGDAEGVSGAMAAISKTTGGQISNLMDAVTQLALQIGQVLKPAITATISALQSIVKWISQNLDVIGTLAIVIGVAAAAWAAFNIPVALAIIRVQALTAAQWLLNIALNANPIGLVIAALAAFTAAIIIAWRHSETFRGVILGLWEAMKQVFRNIRDGWRELPNVIIESIKGIPAAVGRVFSGVGDLFSAIFTGDFSSVPGILKNLGADLLKSNPLTAPGVAVAQKLGEGVGDAFSRGFASGADKVVEEAAPATDALARARERITGGKGTGAGGTGGKGVKAGISEIRSAAPKQINITIEKLVEEQNINTQTLPQSAARIKEEVARVLLQAVNDVNVIQG